MEHVLMIEHVLIVGLFEEISGKQRGKGNERN
jgi:hypothetical protein